MLILNQLISQGATRACYHHPNDKTKCIKILFNAKQVKLLHKELKNNQYLHKTLSKFIPICYEIIETDLGQGLVMDLILNDNGEIAPNLQQWTNKNKFSPDILSQFETFFSLLFEHRLWFYDFNNANFVIQHKDGRDNVIFIDTKSFNHNNSWSMLKLEYVIPFLARRRMKRRIHRFYVQNNLPFPPSLP